MAGRQFTSDSFGTFDVGGYWKVVVGKLGYPISLWKVEEAYFLGHLAKYVPGKALVLVVRSSKLADQGVPIATGIVSIFVETLIMMAVGATLGALGLFAKGGSTELVLLSLGMAVAATFPTAPPMFRLGLRWLATRKRVRFDFAFLGKIDWKMIGSGWSLAGCGWLLQTIALWCLLRGMVSSDLVTDWYDPSLWNACLIAATLPVVAGFVSFMPGGAGVREYVMMVSLASIFGNVVALSAAIAMRLVSLSAEFMAYALLKVVSRDAT